MRRQPRLTRDEEALEDAADRECGALCPEAVGWPYGGLVTCSLLDGHDGDHTAFAERRPGAWDLLETWP